MAKAVPKKIFIFKVGAIGDTIMTTPFLEALRKKFPKATIDYYIGKASAAAITQNPCIDNVYTFDEKIVFNKQALKVLSLANKIRKKKYDIGICLDKSYLVSWFMFLCKPKIRVGFDRSGEGKLYHVKVPYQRKMHEIDQYLNIAYALGAKKVNRPKPLIIISEEDESVVTDMLGNNGIAKQNYIVAIPGGAQNIGVGLDSARRLSDEVWIATINELTKNNIVCIAGGPSDIDQADYIVSKIKNKKNIYNFAGKFSIPQSTALFKHANAVICIDSGPMHMASTVAKKMVCIFGPSCPANKAPRYIKVHNIWKKADQDNYDSEYEYRGKKPAGNFMQTVTANDIIAAVRKL